MSSPAPGYFNPLRGLGPRRTSRALAFAGRALFQSAPRLGAAENHAAVPVPASSHGFQSAPRLGAAENKSGGMPDRRRGVSIRSAAWGRGERTRRILGSMRQPVSIRSAAWGRGERSRSRYGSCPADCFNPLRGLGPRRTSSRPAVVCPSIQFQSAPRLGAAENNVSRLDL